LLDLHRLAERWSVSFALGLALLLFLVKLVVHRRLTPIDWLAGFAELPSDIAAACLSLAGAYLWLKSADAKVGSLAFILLSLSFVITTALFRYVDEIKIDLRDKPLRILSAMLISYGVLAVLSVSVVIDIYSGVRQ
jgi:hypothetical protein